MHASSPPPPPPPHPHFKLLPIFNADAEGGRLSIASLAAFLFYLAQFTASGLQIIFTFDEVCVGESVCIRARKSIKFRRRG